MQGFVENGRLPKAMKSSILEVNFMTEAIVLLGGAIMFGILIFTTAQIVSWRENHYNKQEQKWI